MENAIEILFNILIVIFSVVIHEVSHGYAALMLGDHTAEYEGRLTLNPLKHLDPFGSIIVPFLSYVLGGVVFGWARPVPYNPYNLRNQKWGPAMVGAAGPLANFFIAIIFGLLLRFMPLSGGVISGIALYNFVTIAATIAFLNLVLAFFNLIPIPPLDGSKVLFALLPYRWMRVQAFLEQYELIIFLLFIFLFSGFLVPLVIFMFRILTGTSPFF